MSFFKYTHAIICRIPKSFQTGALGTVGKIDLDLAIKQQQKYVSILRDIGLDVIELPPDENHPDCVFVEDTAVVCNGQALICRPGAKSRRNEVEYMRSILKNELELPIIEIEDKKATLDGGDVLFTGKEFFVGLSNRTNEAGAKALAKAFPDFPCSPITIRNHLHLKSVMSMAGPDVICVAKDLDAQEALKHIENLATFRYQTLTVPDLTAANVVFANGTMIYQDGFPESAKIFADKMGHWDLKPISFTETAKADGCLTCSSILIKMPKKKKRLL